MRGTLSRLRPWLSLAAAVLAVILLVPPVGTLARRYVFVESLQFVLFATAVPALLVLGAPWRALGLARPGQSGRLRQLRGRSAVARLVLPHPGGSGTGHAAATVIVFVLAVIGWRLPVSVNALATVPGLAVAEMLVFLVIGGTLWLELVESPPLLPRISRAQRAAFAAFPMWGIWIVAYVLGFSHSTWYGAYHHASGAALSAVADQELSTGIMWAVPALCFVPVVAASLLVWLRDTEDPDAELGKIASAPQPHAARWPRPPRGWQSPRA